MNSSVLQAAADVSGVLSGKMGGSGRGGGRGGGPPGSSKPALTLPLQCPAQLDAPQQDVRQQEIKFQETRKAMIKVVNWQARGVAIERRCASAGKSRATCVQDWKDLIRYLTGRERLSAVHSVALYRLGSQTPAHTTLRLANMSRTPSQTTCACS